MKLDSKIEFTSTVNVGSTFWFTIEIDEPFFPSEKSLLQNINKELVKDIIESSKNMLNSSREGHNKGQRRVSRKRSFTNEVDTSKYDNISGSSLTSKAIQNYVPDGKFAELR